MSEKSKAIRLLSPNMLKTFEQCPKKFNFKYNKGISMPVNDEIFEFGKNIHALASYYLRKEYISKMETALNTKEKEVWEYLKSCIYFGYEVIATEYNLSFRIKDRYIGGRLDALVKNNDTYYILDYKTGATPKDAKFDFQTITYILAVHYFYRTDNIVFVYLNLKNREETKIEYSDELKKEYLKKLEDTLNKIDNSEFSGKKNECNCEYLKICY